MLKDEIRLNSFFTCETFRYSHDVEVCGDKQERQGDGKSLLRGK